MKINTDLNNSIPMSSPVNISGFTPTGEVDPAQEPTFVPAPQKVANPVEQEAIRNEAEQKDPEKLHNTLEKAVDQLNKTALIFDRSLRFQVHDKTREAIVSVVDSNTDKVIREIPAKEILDFVSRMKNYLGMIFDRKA
ncbi:flagellar protein FlaG [bacterium]|nr:flagellar protein FlaG [bacterium]